MHPKAITLPVAGPARPLLSAPLDRLSKRWRSLSSVATLLFIWTGPALADGWIDVVVAGTRYDNLTRAADRADRRADSAATATASGGHYLAFSGQDGLSLTLDLRGEAYARYHDLDMLGIGGTASYRRKFGLGALVPWLALTATGARDTYRDATRDSIPSRIAAEVGQRFSARFDGRLRAELDHRIQRHDPEPEVPGYSARAFDLRGRAVQGTLEYAVSDALLLGLTVGVRRGDVESTAHPSLPIFRASDAIAEDPAFHDPELYAYRLHATTYATTLAASWTLSPRSSINVGYADNRSYAAYGIHYTDRAISVALAYRFP